MVGDAIPHLMYTCHSFARVCHLDICDALQLPWSALDSYDIGEIHPQKSRSSVQMYKTPLHFRRSGRVRSARTGYQQALVRKQQRRDASLAKRKHERKSIDECVKSYTTVVQSFLEDSLRVKPLVAIVWTYLFNVPALGKPATDPPWEIYCWATSVACRN